MIDSRFVSPLAPKEICFEAMVIDAMCFFEDKCATDQEILTSMRLNPFCLIDDEQVMLGVSTKGEFTTRRFEMFYGT